LSQLSIRGVAKRFGDTRAVDDVSLDIASGEFVTLLGDSGCGKTTLLRIVAGFAAPDAGGVWRDGEDVTHLAPLARRMGFVFQSYALFPTKTVAENIGFALKIARQGSSEIRSRVAELGRMMEIDRLLDRFPHELSGGQQQRVALARAMAINPGILLLDEPLSALDARIRAKLREEIRAIVDRLGVTAIYVTHDQEEALALSDRVAVMRAGRIEQIGSPSDIYHRPASRFVAEFVGTSNLVDGHVCDGGVASAGRIWPARLPDGARTGLRATAIYRPEHLVPAAPEDADFLGHVEAVTFLGATVRLRVGLGSQGSLVVDTPSGSTDFAVASRIALRVDRARATALLDSASA
jgi:putative spermidine/putrescine transport system ATP-binding protein